MATFVMLSRLAPEMVQSPGSFEQLERQAMERIRKECPQVEWLLNLAVLGPYDYVDVFRAPDIETAMKVAVLIRSYGHASTEVWGATDWARFKELGRSLGRA